MEQHFAVASFESWLGGSLACQQQHSCPRNPNMVLPCLVMILIEMLALHPNPLHDADELDCQPMRAVEMVT